MQSDNYSKMIINLDDILKNYCIIQRKSLSSSTSAVLKANAYGLGMIRIGSFLYRNGCSIFFVAYADEAITLRPYVPKATIYVLNGTVGYTQKDFVAHSITPVLCTYEQFKAWDQAFPYALFFDSGMNRAGISLSDIQKIEHAVFKDPECIISHFACADVKDHPFNNTQYENFLKIRKRFPNSKASLCNSSGIFLNPSFHFDIVRPGMALYGLNPTPYQDNPMVFPIQILARVVQTRNITANESVGYNQDFIAKRLTRIATLSVGYADGIPWNLSKSHKPQYVLFGTFKAPIVGRISMDLITVDITDLPVNAVHENDWACVFGAFNQHDWHYDDSHSPYEKLTGFGNRFKKQYIISQELSYEFPQEHNCSMDNDSFANTVRPFLKRT